MAFSAPAPVNLGLTTLTFPCHGAVVGALVGRGWDRVKILKKQFEEQFPGFTFDVTHRDAAFYVIMPAINDAVAFISESFGEEISIANYGMNVHEQYVGRIIGSGGHNLRTIEAGVSAVNGCEGCKCTSYHEDGAFYVRFPSTTPVGERKLALEYIETRIFEHANYLEEKLMDAFSTSSEASSMYSSTCSETSEATSLACSEYTDDGDWPQLA